MVKLWNKLSTPQRYVLACIAFLWLSAAICGTAGAAALAGFITAAIFGIAGIRASTKEGEF